MEEFGRECFDYTAKFDFYRQKELQSAFTESKEPARIIKELALYSQVPLVAGKTLLIFDVLKTMHSDNERIRMDNLEPLIGFYTDLMRLL